VRGSTAREALACSLDLARHAERLGYTRFWVAEHHGMPGIASAATSVVIGHVAAGTKTIRVGAGGIMLPNHAPLIIAEQFGTLESLFPGRIDLGLGRAPGTDRVTAMALRRDLHGSPDDFPNDVVELIDYFSPEPRQPTRAVPGTGLEVPIWILGSSLFGAELAAKLGLPYAFASHFAPRELDDAIDIYRRTFQPSARLQAPYVMAGFNVFAADTDEEARAIASSQHQAFIALRTGRPTALPPPDPGFLDRLPPEARFLLEGVLSCSAIGTESRVREALTAFVERTRVDEVIVASMIYDHAARVRSYEITKAAADAIE
jgi:luciferase family oxidoreductase group 1